MKLAAGVLSSLVVAVVLVASSVEAQLPPEERILVTDPEMLALMGFAPDAEAYLWIRGIYADPLAGMVPVAADSPEPQAPGGGSPNAFLALAGSSFRDRRTGGFTRQTLTGAGELFCASASDPFVDAQIQLPPGADLEFIRVWGYDNCAEDLEIFLQRNCLPDFGPGPDNLETIGSVSTTGTPGDFSVLLAVPPGGGSFGIDNLSCVYWVRARLDDGVINCSCGSNLRLSKARVQFEYSDEGYVPTIGNN